MCGVTQFTPEASRCGLETMATPLAFRRLLGRSWRRSSRSRTSPEKLAETGLKHPVEVGSVAIRPIRQPIGRCDGQADGTSGSPSEQRARHTSVFTPCRLLLENGRDGRKSECGRCRAFRDARQSSVNSNAGPFNGVGEPVVRPSGRATNRRVTPAGEANCCSQRRFRSTYARSPTRTPSGVWE